MKENRLLIDNWTLQEIADLVNNGISDRGVGKFIYDRTSKNYQIQIVPDSAVQIECLFKILTQIVTSDVLIIDKAFQHAWEGKIKPLDNLSQKKVFKLIQFEKTSAFHENRDLIIESFNLPKPIMDKHLENVEYWKKYRVNKYSTLSPLIWGTAGNLSRGISLGIPYSPYPGRASFLECTTLSSRKLNANDEVLNIIQNKRVNVIKRVHNQNTFDIGILRINPVIIDVIESAKSINNLFTVALQMRDEYKRLRRFIKEYQTALDEGDIKTLFKQNNLLDEVENKIIDKSSFNKYGEIELNFGFGKLKGKFDVLRNLQSKIGLRSTFERMILKKNSMGTLDKLLKMFGEDNIELKESIKKYFLEKE